MAFEGTIDDGAPVFGSDGHKLGRVGQVFVLQGTDEPTWIAVQTGLFGMQESFVPVAGASMRGDELIVAYDKAFVKDAPRITGSDDLTVEQEAELYRYYGVEPPLRSQHEAQGGPQHRPEHDGSEHPQQDRPRDAARDDRPSSAAGQEPAREGSPRLRRRVVTEMQTVQVPVQREEIVVEGEGIEPDGDADRR